MKETLKTACCYNCKFLDEMDYIKEISPPPSTSAVYKKVTNTNILAVMITKKRFQEQC
jgi:hypothetical protein